MDVLEALKAAAARLVVVDRGHKHSSGASESHFWLGPPPDGGHSSGEPGLPQCPGANPGCSMPGATLEEDAEPTKEAADKVSTAEVTRLRQHFEAGPPAETEVAEEEPVWSLQDTTLLLRACVRDQAVVQRKLSALSSAELTDLEHWAKTKFGYKTLWSDAEIANMHRWLCAQDFALLFLVMDWLGQGFVADRGRPPQDREAVPAAPS
jgi:hypothetical protein